MPKRKSKMTRAQFEAIFYGEWVNMAGGRYRKNGRFQTSVVGQDKIIRFAETAGEEAFAVKGTSWEQIAKSLGLNKVKQDDDINQMIEEASKEVNEENDD